MMRSMTGFGAASFHTPWGNFNIELRSLNHRFLDISVRMPASLSPLEFEVRNLLKKEIKRGKVDVFIKWEQEPHGQSEIEINVKALKSLYKNLARVTKELGVKQQIPLVGLLQVPHCINVRSRGPEPTKLWQALASGIIKAINRLIQARAREGKMIKKSLKEGLNRLDQLHQEVNKAAPQLVSHYRTRLKNKLTRISTKALKSVSANRLEEEVLMMAERADITEELERLKAHIKTFQHYISNRFRPAAGNPLNFLTQELLREANTMANKAHDTIVVQNVLEMKNEIEKLRQQVQNLE